VDAGRVFRSEVLAGRFGVLYRVANSLTSKRVSCILVGRSGDRDWRDAGDAKYGVEQRAVFGAQTRDFSSMVCDFNFERERVRRGPAALTVNRRDSPPDMLQERHRSFRKGTMSSRTQPLCSRMQVRDLLFAFPANPKSRSLVIRQYIGRTRSG
jgi:hypothetical protein